MTPGCHRRVCTRGLQPELLWGEAGSLEERLRQVVRRLQGLPRPRDREETLGRLKGPG